MLKAQDFNILNQTEDMPTFEDFLEFVMTDLTGRMVVNIDLISIGSN